MPSSDLTWTKANSPVNRIDEYRVFKSTNVLPTAAGFAASFSLLDTDEDLLVINDPDPPFGDTHPLTFSDTAVDFSTNFYCYRVDAYSVLVGEATGGSPQTGVGPSNIICIGTPNSPATLSGDKISDNQLDLSWVNGSGGILPVFSTQVFRSVNSGPFTLLATVLMPTLIYVDTTVDNSINTYDYFVRSLDEASIQSDASNTVTFALFAALIAVIDSGGSNDNQRIATSRDGVTFLLQATPNLPCRDITYSVELSLFCCVGSNGVVLTSPDGIEWITQTSGNSQNWQSVAWSDTLMLFAAVSSTGATNRVMTSPDGVTWTLRPSPDTQTWTHIEWVPFLSMFIACHNQNTSTSIMTSLDGLVWTAQTTPLSAIQQADELAFSGALVVTNNASSSDGYMTSLNGIVWTGRDPSDVSAFTGIAFGNNIWVRVDPFGNNDSHRNADPQLAGNWSDIDTGLTNAIDIKFATLLDLWLIVSNTNLYTISLDDGLTWAASQSFPSKGINGNWIRSVEGRQPASLVEQEMVMCDQAAINLANRSVNSFAWTTSSTGSGTGFDGIAYSPSLGLYVGVGDGVCFSSPDGISWTSRTISAQDWQEVYWDDFHDLFIATATETGTNQIATSPDGIAWTDRTTPDNFRGFAVASDGAGAAICCGFNASTNPVGNNLFSLNGTTWSVGSDPGNSIGCAVYDPSRSRFVQIDNQGRCNVSTDGGATWTLNINSADIGAGANVLRQGVDYSASLDQLVFAGDIGLFSSEDGGVSWTLRDSNDWQDVKYSTVLNKWIVINNVTPRLKFSVDGITWVEGFTTAGSWNSIALGDAI